MTLPLLDVADLTVSYPLTQGRFRAVDQVSFAIEPGQAFGLVGESGSGKTTTAMAILRLLRPPATIDSGRICLDGVDLMSLGPEALRRLRWSRISLVPQGAMNSLNPVMRVREQIADVIVTHEGPTTPAALDARIVELLTSVGLPIRVARMYPNELSGGMKQRVCIAMAVALQPSLIIADEPTSALDVVVQRMVAQTLLDVRERLNASLLLIGHDMGLQAQLVDRLAVMYRGRLVEVGSVGDIFRSPVHPYTRLLITAVPSIRGPGRVGRERGTRASTLARWVEGACALGGACDRGRLAQADGLLMHEVGAGHLVACGAVAVGVAGP